MKRIAVVLAVLGALAGALLAQAAFSAPKAGVTVNVTARDFNFKLSKLKVAPGTTVRFKVTNKGNTVHDFDFSAIGKGTPYIAPGKSKSYTVTFKRAGSYRFVCTVPRHVELGMSGNFLVK